MEYGWSGETHSKEGQDSDVIWECDLEELIGIWYSGFVDVRLWNFIRNSRNLLVELVVSIWVGNYTLDAQRQHHITHKEMEIKQILEKV